MPLCAIKCINSKGLQMREVSGRFDGISDGIANLSHFLRLTEVLPVGLLSDNNVLSRRHPASSLADCAGAGRDTESVAAEEIESEREGFDRCQSQRERYLWRGGKGVPAEFLFQDPGNLS